MIPVTNKQQKENQISILSSPSLSLSLSLSLYHFCSISIYYSLQALSVSEIQLLCVSGTISYLLLTIALTVCAAFAVKRTVVSEGAESLLYFPSAAAAWGPNPAYSSHNSQEFGWIWMGWDEMKEYVGGED